MTKAFGAIEWPLAVMVLLLVFVALALWAANLRTAKNRQPDAIDRFADRFGAANWPRPVKLVIGALWAGIVTILLCGALFLFFRILIGPPVGADDAAAQIGATIFSFTATIAALGAAVAFPFTLTRLHYTRRQVLTAEESLFNEKINAAATDLAARRQVTRVIGEGDEQKILTELEDDIVTRAAAIDRLEGLVEENHAAGDRVARMLSIYVRELSRQPGLQAKTHPRQEWRQRVDQGEDADTVAAELFVDPSDNTSEYLIEWAHGLEAIRSDMEKAVQTLGRLQSITDATLPIDLRRANLQGFDLNGLNFDKAQF